MLIKIGQPGQPFIKLSYFADKCLVLVGTAQNLVSAHRVQFINLSQMGRLLVLVYFLEQSDNGMCRHLMASAKLDKDEHFIYIGINGYCKYTSA
jgi:hypothetical protein